MKQDGQRAKQRTKKSDVMEVKEKRVLKGGRGIKDFNGPITK